MFTTAWAETVFVLIIRITLVTFGLYPIGIDQVSLRSGGTTTPTIYFSFTYSDSPLEFAAKSRHRIDLPRTSGD